MKRPDMMMMIRRVETNGKRQRKSVCTDSRLYGCLYESEKASLAGNLDAELFCTYRGEGSRAFSNP